MKNLLHGVFPAMLSPLDENMTIKYEGLEAFVEFLIGKNVDGLYVLGTTGEWPLITNDRKRELLGATLKGVNGRVPVMAHIGMLPVSEACEFARDAGKMGVRAISSIPPYYFPFGEEDIFRYYEMILKAVSPETTLFLYNIPGFARNRIPLETVKRLCEYPNFGGLKDSEGDKERLLQYISAVGEERIVLIGADELMGYALANGARGCISGNANVMPELMVQLFKSVRQGNKEQQQALQGMVDELADATGRGNIPLLKLGVALRGIGIGKALPPFCNDIPEKAREKLESTIGSILGRLSGMGAL